MRFLIYSFMFLLSACGGGSGGGNDKELAAPSNVKVDTAEFGPYYAALVTWNVSDPGVEGVEIEYNVNGGSFSKAHDGLLAASSHEYDFGYSDHPELTRFAIRMRSKKADVYSDYTVPVEFKRPLFPPNKLAYNDDEAVRVTTSWKNMSSVADEVVIERLGSLTETSWTKIATLSATNTTFKDEQYLENQTYEYRFAAKKGADLSAYSTLSIREQTIRLPQQFKATANGSEIDLSWVNSSKFLTGFNIKRAFDPYVPNYEVIATVDSSTTSFVDTLPDSNPYAIYQLEPLYNDQSFYDANFAVVAKNIIESNYALKASLIEVPFTYAGKFNPESGAWDVNGDGKIEVYQRDGSIKVLEWIDPPVSLTDSIVFDHNDRPHFFATYNDQGYEVYVDELGARVRAISEFKAVNEAQQFLVDRNGALHILRSEVIPNVDPIDYRLSHYSNSSGTWMRETLATSSYKVPYIAFFNANNTLTYITSHDDYAYGLNSVIGTTITSSVIPSFSDLSNRGSPIAAGYLGSKLIFSAMNSRDLGNGSRAEAFQYIVRDNNFWSVWKDSLVQDIDYTVDDPIFAQSDQHLLHVQPTSTTIITTLWDQFGVPIVNTLPYRYARVEAGFNKSGKFWLLVKGFYVSGKSYSILYEQTSL